MLNVVLALSDGYTPQLLNKLCVFRPHVLLVLDAVLTKGRHEAVVRCPAEVVVLLLAARGCAGDPLSSVPFIVLLPKSRQGFASSKLPECHHLQCPSICPGMLLRPRSYQSVAIYCVLPPPVQMGCCANEVSKVSLLSCSPLWPGSLLRPRSYQSVHIHCVQPSVQMGC